MGVWDPLALGGVSQETILTLLAPRLPPFQDETFMLRQCGLIAETQSVLIT
jgi:hypothetical protein